MIWISEVEDDSLANAINCGWNKNDRLEGDPEDHCFRQFGSINVRNANWYSENRPGVLEAGRPGEPARDSINGSARGRCSSQKVPDPIGQIRDLITVHVNNGKCLSVRLGVIENKGQL